MKKSKAATSKKPVNAKPEHYFILITGIPLKNLKELALSFETMNDWVFNHHVNDSRNDFSNWIKDIIGEEELAEEIRNIKDMRSMEIVILRHLVNKHI